jgi:hypothetical protein
MKIQWQDLMLRALIVSAGVIAAALFVIQGDAEALPPLAFGGAVAACVIRGFSGGREQEG